MKENIDSVIAKCLTEFNDLLPKTVAAALKEQPFMTAVQEVSSVYEENGVARPVMTNSYYIDFTAKMTYDEDEFFSRSQKLYNLFGRITRWYEV